MDASQPLIMIVDDDPNDIALFQRAVYKSGLTSELLVAQDGEKALQMLHTLAAAPRIDTQLLPRLILLDLKMPRLSGLEVLAQIRVNPLLRSVPVVVFTSSRELSDITHAYDLGANSYLVKPVSFDDLMTMVHSIHRYWIELNESPSSH